MLVSKRNKAGVKSKKKNYKKCFRIKSREFELTAINFIIIIIIVCRFISNMVFYHHDQNHHRKRHVN